MTKGEEKKGAFVNATVVPEGADWRRMRDVWMQTYSDCVVRVFPRKLRVDGLRFDVHVIVVRRKASKEEKTQP